MNAKRSTNALSTTAKTRNMSGFKIHLLLITFFLARIICVPNPSTIETIDSTFWLLNYMFSQLFSNSSLESG